MRNIIWFLALFILLIIQGGILVPLHIAPLNLILVVIALAPILSDFKQGIAITILGGLLLDFTSGSPDGLMTMSLLLAFLLLQLVLRELLSREPNKFILGATVAASTIFYYLSFIALSKIFVFLNLAQNPDINYLLDVQLPLAILWNLIFTYPIYYYYILTQNLASKLPFHEEPIRT